MARLTKAYAHLRARRRPREVAQITEEPMASEAERLQELTTENSELKDSLDLLKDTLHNKEELIK